ncbi:MAG: hypothetical protein CMO81_04805 [Waddliaceae bacterium]|nr:hypothetical protein [Waddliaceae bacterium]|tara:strand:+ start:629 stop:1363 length:735 start_codon:yes stop_codon:yes gene_type:complete
MSKINSLLSKRLEKSTESPKAKALAQHTAGGERNSFAGLFGRGSLSESEKSTLEEILRQYTENEENIQKDLELLSAITSEVKAITNQAAILHGERIKQAQTILKKYQEGAFTSWLIATYGNRQTPYNFLQYYEFWNSLPNPLRPKLDKMPRQAVYALASRQGSSEDKQSIVEKYKGETKKEVLDQIREVFPLPDSDRRRVHSGDIAVQKLTQVVALLAKPKSRLNKTHKRLIRNLIFQLNELVS